MAKVTTIGFTEFATKAANLPDVVLKEVDRDVEDSADLWVQLATTTAPERTRRMANNITQNKIAFLNYQVTAPISYTPYQEFGTGALVFSGYALPAEIIQYAAQFKGRGIRQVNIAPRKFFFIHLPQVEKFMNEKITNILNTEH